MKRIIMLFDYLLEAPFWQQALVAITIAVVGCYAAVEIVDGFTKPIVIGRG